MRRVTRWVLPGLAVVLLVAGLIAYGGRSQSSQREISPAVSDKSTAGATAGGSSSKPAAAIGAPSSSAASSAAPSASSAGSSTDTLPALDTQQMIVRNADLSLAVENVEQALARVRQTVAGAGGMVFSSSTTSDGTNPVATLTLQVPADQFDNVMTALRTAAGVRSVERESVTSQDVTDEYVDLQSRQRNLEATEQQYLTLLTTAKSINDTLAVEHELTRVQSDLEQVKGRIKFLDQRTAFSRINLTLHVAAATSSVHPSSGFVRAIENAWADSLEFTGAVLRAVATVVVFLWWFWPLAGAAAYVLLRRRQHLGRASAPTES